MRGGHVNGRDDLKDEKGNYKSRVSGKPTKESLLGGHDEVRQTLHRGRLSTADREFRKWNIHLPLGEFGHEKMPMRGGCVPMNELYVLKFCEMHQLFKL